MESTYRINLQKVINSNKFSSIVKLTATQLLNNPYMTLGNFFKNLSTNDLTTLSLMVEMLHTDEQSQLDLICLVEMLTRAEGIEETSVDIITENVNYFCMLISIALLHNRGVADMKFDKLSFGREMLDEVIVELKQ